MYLVKVVEEFNFWNRIFILLDSERILLKRIFFKENFSKKNLFSKILSESKNLKILFQKLNSSTTFTKYIYLLIA